MDQDLSNFFQNAGSAQLAYPKYDGQCVSNLPDTFTKLLGISANRAIAKRSFYDYAQSSQIENLVFLLLDGFGFYGIRNASEQIGTPSVDKVVQSSYIMPLTSVFPSTTSTATTSLHTGLTPQEHGIIGYTMYMKEIGAIVQMLEFAPIFSRRSLFEIGFDPTKMIGKKTLHERLLATGIQSNLYINKYIVGSGLCQVTNRGAKLFPILTAPDLFVSLRKNLETRLPSSSPSSSSPSFHFAYYASPDTIAHSRGPFSDAFGSEIEGIFHSLQRELIEKLNPDVRRKTLLLISADHGLSSIRENDLVDIAEHPVLLKELKVPPTGDSRCVILHAKSEEAIPRIEDYFETHFRNKFHLMKSKDALRKGLFGVGEVRNEVPDRIGDLICIPQENLAIDNSNVQPRSDYVPGRHGGLSPEEMLVPLIAKRL